ncbi:MAG: hypothetical protein ACYTEQ_15450 [Planctomycetota bacterium]
MNKIIDNNLIEAWAQAVSLPDSRFGGTKVSQESSYNVWGYCSPDAEKHTARSKNICPLNSTLAQPGPAGAEEVFLIGLGGERFVGFSFNSSGACADKEGDFGTIFGLSKEI